MGENKKLRKKIASLRRVVRDHEEKMRHEQALARPDEGVIGTWLREIAAANKKIDSYMRHLKKEW